MKVALIGPFPPYRGGIAQFTGILSDTLESLGHDVIRISYSRLYPGILFPGTSQYEPDTGPSGSRAARMLDSCWPPSWLSVRKLLRSHLPDRIILKWWHPFFAPALSGALPPESSSRSVLVCHNVLPHDRFPGAAALFRRLAAKSSLVVVHSTEDMETARGVAPGAELLRLYHPAYEQYVRPDVSGQRERQSLGFAPDEKVILFFGMIRPYKGLSDLILAISGLPGNARLLMVGESYGMTDEIRGILHSSGMGARAVWVDRFVGADEVAGFFESADIVALPYRHATQSGVAQIALAFRKPLVLTRTGGLPELVEEGVTGFLARPGDPEDLRRAIEACLSIATHPDTPERIAEFARRFDWEIYARSLLGEEV
ncbi:glycosyltransferase family 4 protein [Candidatus Fermentibacterales bacterium]|nr:glycosyltransferase family 4 protein [Candidatus Fermentibacterales bacterium]